ncbi:hypothetical protein GCM10025867_50890 (plasmid) [Frondihabitans sucicola]|uniref:Uncharacterized protein n=1 Tax=Frondihabitans sucicola TaxID=1268041 RepID=A0ABM8GWT4_9MICO|nr:hypothetical protein [Frondihabitans sucicola]BDZ52848.1 hypothetical protein GCM10025867_50890 [Frondihabitans sucicola]
MSEISWVYQESSIEVPGGDAVIEFEVDEHLVPRCEVAGCTLRWSSQDPNIDSRRMCAGHASVRNARQTIIHALGTAHQAAEYAMGYPDAHFDALGAASTLGSTAERRAYALSHAEWTGEGMTRTLTRAIADLTAAEADGFTLSPWHYAFGEWNHLPQTTIVETVAALDALPVKTVVKGRFDLIAVRTSGRFWSQPGSVEKVRTDELFGTHGPRFEVLSTAS